MKILFMGTPDFALVSLRRLYESGENIAAVMTQPDKPKGRGMTLTPSPVKVYAQSVGLPVYQPQTLRDGAFAALLREIAPELIVVVAYGRLLPESVLTFPVYGCINAHGSLLPKYRGAAPIQRALMNGETETGVTAMYMAVGMDTGDMICTERVGIAETDNFETLHDKMAEAGAVVLLRAITAIRDGTVVRTPQTDAEATYAAKIEKTDCKVDFSGTVRQIWNQIRGLSPMPLAYTHTPDGKLLKLVSARILSEGRINDALCGPGTIVSLDGGVIAVVCGDGLLGITEVLPEGKKKMPASDFIRGRKVAVGDVLTSLDF